MIYFVDALLWIVAGTLAFIAAMRSRMLLRDSAREGVVDFFKLVPRILLGVVGAGYIAALLPQEMVGRWFGADSGVTGLVIAVAPARSRRAGRWSDFRSAPPRSRAAPAPRR